MYLYVYSRIYISVDLFPRQLLDDSVSRRYEIQIFLMTLQPKNGKESLLQIVL